MLFELSEDQALIQDALEGLARGYSQLPVAGHDYVHYSGELRDELAEAGFLGIAASEDCGPLDAALLVERVARLPFSAEVAGSALVGPLLGRELTGPLALCEAVGQPTRYLAEASHACILVGGEVHFADLEPGQARPVSSVIAYPLGVLDALPAGSQALGPELSRQVLMHWRLGLVAEAAGLMRAALDLTVEYVKERRQFGQPLGHFQAIQHRLAADEQIVAASQLLAFHAAYTLDPKDAATALLYAQQHMRTVIYDCHQFTGAMGVTLEYPLHLWTYRLKFIQGELGGRSAQAKTLSDLLWSHGEAAPG